MDADVAESAKAVFDLTQDASEDIALTAQISIPDVVGFSNDVRVKMARPKFAEAAFAHGEGPSRITFAVRKIP